MKRIFPAAVLCLLFTASAHAGLKVIGTGENKQLDPSGFPPVMKSSYQLMQAKCTKCHSMERIVTAVQTGNSPTTLLEFNKKTAKDHCIKMSRKPNANISQQEAMTIADLLYFLIDEAAR